MKELLKYFCWIAILIFGLLLYLVLSSKLGDSLHSFFKDVPQNYKDQEIDGDWKWGTLHSIYFFGQILFGVAYIVFSVSVLSIKHNKYW